MKNPWEEISLADYENHMKLASVMQLQAMNQMMKQQFYDDPISSVMVLGSAGGNGFEHIDKDQFDHVYGIDINQEYLTECKRRYSHLDEILECICTDLTKDQCNLPHVDKVIANLLIEYIGIVCFQTVIQSVKPMYVSCIIQINEAEGFVSDSPYLHIFDSLDQVHHTIEERALTSAMNDIGYHIIRKHTQSLPNGKQLYQLDYSKVCNK